MNTHTHAKKKNHFYKVEWPLLKICLGSKSPQLLHQSVSGAIRQAADTYFTILVVKSDIAHSFSNSENLPIRSLGTAPQMLTGIATVGASMVQEVEPNAWRRLSLDFK